MQTNEFMGQVQHKAGLSNLDEVMRATRATLQTPAEPLGAAEASHIGAQLPQEVSVYLGMTADDGRAERFDSDEFLAKVSEREGVDLPVSVHHVRAVL